MSKLHVSRFIATLLFLCASVTVKAQLSQPQAVSGEYIVKYKSQSGGISAGLRASAKMGSQISVKSVFPDSRMLHIKVGSAAARDALYADPDVEFIEPNYILSVDPLDVSALTGAPPASWDDYMQSNAAVHVKDSWAVQKPFNQGSKVTVAIIDTGLATDHLVFKDSNAIWENSAEKNGVPGVDDDGNGYVDDINGWNFVSENNNPYDDNSHGTHVGGIVLGVGQDILAWPVRESKIQIMPLKFLDSGGAGSTASAINAIYYAVQQGAKVINNSWGGPSYSQSLHEAYAYAYDHGVVIVSAAGNSNTNNDAVPMYPSNLDSPNNISVMATTDFDSKASFSNFGSGTVNVAAPGVAILSSVPGSGCLNPGCFQMMSGTSMAAPFVTGLAALIFREAPQLSAYQVRSIIISTVDPVSGLSAKVSSGGRVNVQSAINSAIAQSATAAWAPSYSPDYKASRNLASDSGSGGASGGCGLVQALGSSDGASGPGAGGMGVLVLLMLPLLIALNLRQKANRRAQERFASSLPAVLQVCGQLVNITTEDISVGGLSFKSAVDLACGQVVKVLIGESEVEAVVVWGSQNQYGLRYLKQSAF